jgi:hypothetical protein
MKAIITSIPTFTYLVKTADSGENQVLCDKYGLTELASMIVIRDECQKKFLVFHTLDEFIAWRQSISQTNRCFHEVIFGKLAQRLKFDIEIPDDKLNDLISKEYSPIMKKEDDVLVDLLKDLGYEENIDKMIQEDKYDPKLAEVKKHEKIIIILKTIINCIINEVNSSYYLVDNMCLSKREIIVTDASGMTKKGKIKYSYHITLVPYAIADSVETKTLSDRIISRVPEEYAIFIDKGVNKKIQNFRMLGSTKLDENRFKKLSNDLAKELGTMELEICKSCDGIICDKCKDPSSYFKKTMIKINHEMNVKILPRLMSDTDDLEEEVYKPEGLICQQVIAYINSKKLADGHTLRGTYKNLICYNRDRPTNCRICNEIHHNDNTLMFSIRKKDKSHSVYEYCRQCPTKKSIFTCEIPDMETLSGVGSITGEKAPTPKTNFYGRLASHIDNINKGIINPHLSLISDFEKLPMTQKHIYSNETMLDLELKPTLAVSAQMKMGKTQAIRKFIDTYFSDQINTNVIRMISFRQTFGRSLLDSFEDFEIYSSIVGDIDQHRHPRVIIQVESLHRLTVTEQIDPVDLLILDECESILSQFSSGLHKHLNAAFAVFKWMLRTAKHVVCLDANISDRTYNTLKSMRSDHPIYFHWNKFHRAEEDKYYFTTKMDAWYKLLSDKVREGKRIVIPVNSLATAEVCEYLLRREFPDKVIQIYSSKTKTSEKDTHFANVNRYWSEMDILIYTPTCSAGVSYEQHHFDMLFGYFSDISCNVETCRQMLGRVRNIEDKEYYICFSTARQCYLPTKTEDIKAKIFNKRTALYRKIDAVQFEYNDDGSVKFYESDFFRLWLETVRIDNLSNNGFIYRFINQVSDTGASVNLLTDEGDEEVKNMIMTAKEFIKCKRNDDISKAVDITDEDALRIKETLDSKKDVNFDDLLSYEKYQLRKDYSWPDKPITEEFVDKYYPPNTRKLYKNLTRLTADGDIQKSINKSQKKERSHYDYITKVNAPSNPIAGMHNQDYTIESRDLIYDKTIYTSYANSLILLLINICGLDLIINDVRFMKRSFASTSCVYNKLLESRLKLSLQTLKKISEDVIFEFRVGRLNMITISNEGDSEKFIRNILCFINRIISSTCGVKICKFNKVYYYLNGRNIINLFAFDKNSNKPYIPMIGNLSPNIIIDMFMESEFYDRLENKSEYDNINPS